LENKLRQSQDDVVISDCRFPNEIQAIKQSGGLVIRVRRGPDPDWYQFAQTVNRGPESNPEWSFAKTQLEKFNIHASETAWAGTQFDAVIDNNSTMDHLYQQVNDLVQDHQYAKASQTS
jgi:hypothetical protein